MKNGPSYTALILSDFEDVLLIQATGESKVSPFGAGIGPRNRLVDEVDDGSKMFIFHEFKCLADSLWTYD